MSSQNNASAFNKKLEILRFLVIGIVATIFDFLTKTLVAGLTKSWNATFNFGVSILAGFVVGVIVNYVFSVLWVFQNVADKHAAKTQSKFWLFVLLGFIGLLISEGIFFGSRYLILFGGVDISVGQQSPMAIFHGDWSFLSSLDFWVYFIIFCLSTLIVLVWNYWSRKKWIFIAPKEGPALAKTSEKPDESKGK
jgi:putative flippase GtrA